MLIYGTLRKCVDEVYKLINFDHLEMPTISYSASTMKNAKTAYEAYRSAEGWFGIVNVRGTFDSDAIVMLFGHFGGGGIESLELNGEDEEEEKELIIQKIGSSTDSCGYGVLAPDDITVFELD